MKLVLLLTFMGLACASFHDGTSYKGKKEMDDELRQEIGNKLSQVLEKIVTKIQELYGKGATNLDKLLKKVKDLGDKLSNLRFPISDKINELVEGFKETAPELYEKLRERLNLVDEETTEEPEAELAYAEFNFKSVFEKLKKLIKDNVDKEYLKEQIEKLFGKGTEMAEQIIQMIKDKGEEGKQKLLELVDRILDDKEKRSIGDVYEKVKEYFKNLNIELKEKYLKFGEWVKNVFEKRLDHTKDKVENIRKIAREFLDRAKEIRKEVATEAQDFFRLYKEDLGSLWDEIKDKVREIIHRNF